MRMTTVNSYRTGFGISKGGLTIEAHAQMARAIESEIGDKGRWRYEFMVPNDSEHIDRSASEVGVVQGDSISQEQVEVPVDAGVTDQSKVQETSTDNELRELDSDGETDLDRGDVSQGNTEAQPIQFIEVNYT